MRRKEYHETKGEKGRRKKAAGRQRWMKENVGDPYQDQFKKVPGQILCCRKERAYEIVGHGQNLIFPHVSLARLALFFKV